jgi:hypothetical protein
MPYQKTAALLELSRRVIQTGDFHIFGFTLKYYLGGRHSFVAATQAGNR